MGKSSSLKQRFQYQSGKGIDLSDYFYSDSLKKLPDDVKGNYETLYKNIAPADIPGRLSKITAEVKDLHDALDFNKQGLFGEAITKVGDFGASSSRNPVAYMQARLTLAEQIKAQLNAESDKRTAGLQATQTDQVAAAKEEAKKNAGEASKAAEQQMRDIETRFAEMGTKLPDEAIAFWSKYVGAFKQGSTEYLHVVEELKKYTDEFEKGVKLSPHLQERMRQLEDTKTLSSDGADRSLDEVNKSLREQAEDVWRTGMRWEAYNAQLAKARELQSQAAAQMQELQIGRELKSGQLSPHDAAMQTAALHAEAYAQKIDALQTDLQTLRGDRANLDPNGKDYETKAPELDARIKEKQNEIDQTGYQAQFTAAQDKLKEFETTGLGGAITALQEFRAASLDISSQLHSLTTDALKGFNSTIVQGISTRNFHWNQQLGNYGAGLFRSASGSLLQGAEGKLLGGLGIGKLGTASNPMHVTYVDGPMRGSLASLGKDLFSGFHPASVAAAANAASGAAASGGFWSGVGHMITHLIPGFADGGDPAAGTTAWVGERGPELVTFGSAAHVTPNHKLNTLGMGSPTIHVDARGANSPAEIEAAGYRGAMRAYKTLLPHTVRATASAIKSDRMRTPSSRRM